jgi:nitric oxide reductase subunit C
LLVLYLFIFMALLAACGGGEAAGAAESQAAADAAALSGDPAAGQALFQQMIVNSAPGCTTCHSTEPGVTQVGPSLARIAERAGERVDGLSAAAYLHQSIVDPGAYVVENFSNLMYQNYREALSEEQIADLVAYLLTLKGG